MAFSSKVCYAVLFMVVLLIMLVIGFAAEVSFTASLNRALMAAASFTFLSWIVITSLLRYVIPEVLKDGAEDPPQSDVGTHLDLTLSEDIPGYEELTGGEQSSEPSGDQNEEVDTAVSSEKQFGQLTTKQIDPQFERIINNDPKRMAEIVKKMGFEE